MTIDELIKELERVKYRHGGDLKVFYESSEDGSQLGVSEVKYTQGSMVDYSGVTIS